MYREIKISNTNDLKNLYEFAAQYDGNLYISGKNNLLLDARSILGLASLVGQEGLKLVFPDHTSAKTVCEAAVKLEKYMSRV